MANKYNYGIATSCSGNTLSAKPAQARKKEGKIDKTNIREEYIKLSGKKDDMIGYRFWLETELIKAREKQAPVQQTTGESKPCIHCGTEVLDKIYRRRGFVENFKITIKGE